MILFDDRLFFVHIPKTAGTTIEESLNKSEHLWGRHMSYGDFIDANKTIQRNEWTFFTVVRNPWDRIHSTYQFRKRFSDITFSQFVEHIKNYFEHQDKGEVYCINDRTPIPFPHRLVQTFDWWTGGADNMDYILKFETIKKDAQKFYESTGYKIDLSTKHQFNPNRTPYKEAYTSNERKIIESIYGEEIELFKYSFH